MHILLHSKKTGWDSEKLLTCWPTLLSMRPNDVLGVSGGHWMQDVLDTGCLCHCELSALSGGCTVSKQQLCLLIFTGLPPLALSCTQLCLPSLILKDLTFLWFLCSSIQLTSLIHWHCSVGCWAGFGLFPPLDAPPGGLAKAHDNETTQERSPGAQRCRKDCRWHAWETADAVLYAGPLPILSTCHLPHSHGTRPHRAGTVTPPSAPKSRRLLSATSWLLA